MTTPRAFLALDIETTKPFPMGSNWRDYAPLGISCAVAQPTDQEDPIIWADHDNQGGYADQISTYTARRMVAELQELSQRYTIVTWNGIGFDWPVIAQEASEYLACRKLALEHVDMMFHLFCVRGFPVSLAAALSGMGLPSKTPGIDGSMATQVWAEGDRQQVVDYCAQDARITASLAEASQRASTLNWTSRRGRILNLFLPNGWLSAQQAMALPYPDTSWMDDPIDRSVFTSWLQEQPA